MFDVVNERKQLSGGTTIAIAGRYLRALDNETPWLTEKNQIKFLLSFEQEIKIHWEITNVYERVWVKFNLGL